MITVETFNSGTYRNNGDFRSFIPSPINDSWNWSSPEISSLLSVADREIGALSTYSEFIPDIEIYVRMHIRVEANKSNRIEGTKTTIEEDMLPIESLGPEKRDDAQEVEAETHPLHSSCDREDDGAEEVEEVDDARAHRPLL